MSGAAFSRDALLARAGVVARTAPVTAAAAAVTTRPAPFVATLPREAFAHDWRDKPETVARIGLRLVSEKTAARARAEASRVAWQEHPEGDDPASRAARADCFSDTLMMVVLADAACMPNDVATPFWPLAEDNIRLALTPEGVAELWEGFGRLKATVGAFAGAATDAELARLSAAVASPETWDRLGAGESARLRRLLRHALDILDA